MLDSNCTVYSQNSIVLGQSSMAALNVEKAACKINQNKSLGKVFRRRFFKDADYLLKTNLRPFVPLKLQAPTMKVLCDEINCDSDLFLNFQLVPANDFRSALEEVKSDFPRLYDLVEIPFRALGSLVSMASVTLHVSNVGAQIVQTPHTHPELRKHTPAVLWTDGETRSPWIFRQDGCTPLDNTQAGGDPQFKCDKAPFLVPNGWGFWDPRRHPHRSADFRPGQLRILLNVQVHTNRRAFNNMTIAGIRQELAMVQRR